MKRVIGYCLTGRLAHPSVESLTQWLTFVLDREINQRGCAAKCRGTCAGFEVIRARRASERHVQMGVHVDAARQQQLSRRVQDTRCIFRWQVFTDCRNFAIDDGNICQIRIGRRHHSSIPNDCIEAHGTSVQSEQGIMLHCRPLVVHNPLPATERDQPCSLDSRSNPTFPSSASWP
jgi:hypothetical protein